MSEINKISDFHDKEIVSMVSTHLGVYVCTANEVFLIHEPPRTLWERIKGSIHPMSTGERILWAVVGWVACAVFNMTWELLK